VRSIEVKEVLENFLDIKKVVNKLDIKDLEISKDQEYWLKDKFKSLE